MASYVIGDIQGCYTPFMSLLSEIGFNPGVDTLYLVGDLVNRGKESLQVLDWVYQHQYCVTTVLGNHDIYLLARYANLRKPDHDDTLSDVLSASHVNQLIGWLRSCPLVYEVDRYIIVHAGVHPRLDFNQLLILNRFIQDELNGQNYIRFIDAIYGNRPLYWHHGLPLIKQMRFAINSCTRMRYLCADKYALDYSYKGNPEHKPKHLIPWFDVPQHATLANKMIIFGHWASLGLYQAKPCIGIDTGCVWGRQLTALNLQNQQVIQVKGR